MRGKMIKKFQSILLMLTALALLPCGQAMAVAVEVDLAVEKVNLTMPNTGEVIPMWQYSVTNDPSGAADPGPPLVIRATDQDYLILNVANNLGLGPGLVEPTSVVIPGQQAESMTPVWIDPETGSVVSTGGNRPDGDYTARVRSFTEEAEAGGSATYQWGNGTSSLKPGTYLIQSGTHPAVQIQMGLYAVLIVEDTSGTGTELYGNAYQSEQVMLFSEIDPVLHAAVYTNNYGPGKAVTSTMHYDPKYYLLNGTPYTDAGDLAITGAEGNNILVRFLNAGIRTRVPQVLEGAYLTVLAEDGNEAPFAVSRNSLMLPAAKTYDVLVENATTEIIPLFDRRLAFSTEINTDAVPIHRIGVFLNGTWYFDSNGNGIWEDGVDLQFSFGASEDAPLMGDWNGDGIDTVGYKRGYTYYLRNSNSPGEADIIFRYGGPSDTPVVGDWNGDGVDTIGIKRRNTYYIRNSNSTGAADLVFRYGGLSDIPVAGDWDGDGVDTIGIKRNYTYYLSNDNSTGIADIVYRYGGSSDAPVVGDWNGDGIDTLGLYRAWLGTFYLKDNHSGGAADITANFGIENGTPFAGDW